MEIFVQKNNAGQIQKIILFSLFVSIFTLIVSEVSLCHMFDTPSTALAGLEIGGGGAAAVDLPKFGGSGIFTAFAGAFFSKSDRIGILSESRRNFFRSSARRRFTSSSNISLHTTNSLDKKRGACNILITK